MAKISYLGHSCFLIETGGKRIITDPFIRPNELARDIDFESLVADVILVSHGHDDHTADLIDLAKQTGALIICNYEIYMWLLSKGIENAHPVNKGGTTDLGFARAKMVAALHSSSLADGRYAGVAAGYVVYNDEDCFYFAGDTALTYDMKLIPEDFDLDFAFMPIGDNFTMGVKDAIKASDFVQCNEVIGMHYDTFGWIKIEKEQAKQAFSDKGKNLTLMGIGEVITMN